MTKFIFRGLSHNNLISQIIRTHPEGRILYIITSEDGVATSYVDGLLHPLS